MKGRGTGFYNPRGLSPVDRAKLDNALGDIADGKVSESDLEAALVEIADMVAAQDDALVEIAGLIE